ncbi:metallophosphoesterase [Streptomyces sp. ZAF1911]|uniref:metallophosphoesterase n=1 Tax=Streptomyces sp. ZAF1911 TaxID=2944129 RepID=UPI00237C0619|nr:metallophosphoesterase [Streptomyces sp. ZAF1911]MDD9378378.1 metallophosphoesterase [Streptomyces sp. ZAF1911]
MTIVLFAAVALLVLALLVLVHRWLWIRLVRDTTAPGGAVRRAGTALAFALPLLSVAALVAGRAGAPFWLERTVAWPGYMWLAVLLYLSLAMLLAEPVRAVWLRRSNAATGPAGSSPKPGPAEPTDPRVPAGEDAPLPGAQPQGIPAAAGADPTGSGAEPRHAAAAAAISGSGAEPQFREGAGRGTVPQATLAATAEPTATAGLAAQAGQHATAAGPAAADSSQPTPAEPAPTTLSRRRFARIAAGTAAAAAAGTVGYGTYGVLRGPRVKRVQVPLAKLPRAAHGFRIAVVSDIHLGPILGRAHTTRIVDTINRTQPDLIAVVGDLVDGSVHDLGPAAEPLRGLRSRHGSYFVTGNHEYFSGARQWVDHVRELGLTPLENARRELPYFDLAGVNDIAGESEGHGPDFQAALGDRDRTRSAVLLAHQPIVIDEAVRYGADLQLSGHTHGGQLWPGEYVAELANPTVAGLERYGDTQLYVSRGAGAWGPPVRVGAPSDITVVELASYQA